MMQVIPQWKWTVKLEDGRIVTGRVGDHFLSNAQRKLHEIDFDGAVSVTIEAMPETHRHTLYTLPDEPFAEGNKS